VTKEGMNSGWVWRNGEFYTKYEKDTILKLKNEYGTEDLFWAYAEGLLYYTEWEEEEFELVDGILTELE
jgi:hypothetical protein